VKNTLEQKGFAYNSVQCMVISHGHVMSTEIHILPNLLESLILLHADKINLPLDIIIRSEDLENIDRGIEKFHSRLEARGIINIDQIKKETERFFKTELEKFGKTPLDTTAIDGRNNPFIIGQFGDRRLVYLNPYKWPPYPWTDEE
jgi:hypothetical protein